MSIASHSPRIVVLNGPNLNLLGTRQPEIYGSTTLKEIESDCQSQANKAGYALEWFQTNHEGVLIDQVQAARTAQGLLINAAGYTHTSVALLDALLTVEAPVIEVHLSHPHKREAFRHHSVIAPACRGTIAGFGALSYQLALDAVIALINASNPKKEG